MRQMIGAMFKGFRIGVDLEVTGTDRAVQRRLVTGKRITLAEIDDERLLQESNKLGALDQMLSPDASITKMQNVCERHQGLKIN